MLVGRRAALGLMAASMAPRAVARPVTGGVLRDFIRMRGALDGRLVIGCVTGIYSGVVNEVSQPLFGVVSAVFSQYRPHLDGFDLIEFEQAYYTDLLTGAALTRWKNPYTNALVDVPAYSRPVARSYIGPEFEFVDQKAPGPGVSVQHQVRRGPALGGDLVYVESLAVRVAGAGGKPPFYYRDATVLRSPMAALQASKVASVGSKTVFTAVVSWRPWLQMAGQPGHLEALGYGGFGVSQAELPTNWVEATQKLRPALLRDPAALLATPSAR